MDDHAWGQKFKFEGDLTHSTILQTYGFFTNENSYEIVLKCIPKLFKFQTNFENILCPLQR